MFKLTATAVAITALFSSGAMAQTLTKGQYFGVTQYTGLVDPLGACAPLVPVGVVTNGVATVAGVGKYVTTTISNPTSAAAHGLGSAWEVGYIQCYYPKIPTTYPTTTDNYKVAPYNPGPSNPITCSASNGITYNLSVGNGTATLVDGTQVTQTSTVSIEVNPPGNGVTTLGTLSPYKFTSGNAVIVVGGSALCALSVDQAFQRSGV